MPEVRVAITGTGGRSWDLYAAAVRRAGGLPVAVADDAGPERVAGLIGRVDALLLTGGVDIDPAIYGQRRRPGTDPPDPARDTTELAAYRLAIEAGRPVLGICRGHQLVHVARGGTLFQDLDQEIEEGRNQVHRHYRVGERVVFRRHRSRIEGRGHLRELVDADEVEVNSAHHQAVDRLGAGMLPTAWSADGILEASRSTGASEWVRTVQFHPERMLLAPDAWVGGIFGQLIEAAALQRRAAPARAEPIPDPTLGPWPARTPR